MKRVDLIWMDNFSIDVLLEVVVDWTGDCWYPIYNKFELHTRCGILGMVCVPYGGDIDDVDFGGLVQNIYS